VPADRPTVPPDPPTVPVDRPTVPPDPPTVPALDVWVVTPRDATMPLAATENCDGSPPTASDRSIDETMTGT
jgi:hypothetical protein